jgi:3-deoxy-7-phosphoheptulonate synthase
MHSTDDLRISALQSLLCPEELVNELPLTSDAFDIIHQARLATSAILHGKDQRLLVIVGPCSVHDIQAALEYAERLKTAALHFADDLHIVMRVYLEKPRTVLGWKGLISDPYLDGSFDINFGLRCARKLLLDLANIGVASATEFLDTIIPQYLSDLISWCGIGARTSQSQIHRELASGLSMPVGFKNTTDGNIKIAVDAVNTARHPHHFLGISKTGVTSIITTRGNDDCHIILRGSHSGPNYFAENISAATGLLKTENLIPHLVVDCSHGNSEKNYLRQAVAVDCLAAQIHAGSREIFGVMLESNLLEGRQELVAGLKLKYGQSITDACISWDDTVPLLEKLAIAARERKKILSQKKELA